MRLPAQRDYARRKKLKLEFYAEYHGIENQTLIDPETGATRRGHDGQAHRSRLGAAGPLLRLKTGQSAEQWVGEQISAVYGELGLRGEGRKSDRVPGGGACH